LSHAKEPEQVAPQPCKQGQVREGKGRTQNKGRAKITGLAHQAQLVNSLRAQMESGGSPLWRTHVLRVETSDDSIDTACAQYRSQKTPKSATQTLTLKTRSKFHSLGKKFSLQGDS
jgi:hypothetical protein